MISGGVASVALSIIKIATALTVSTAIIYAVQYFNTFELKGKRGGRRDVPVSSESLRETVKPRR